jgi:hypothetical protein
MKQYTIYSQTSRKLMVQLGAKYCTIFSQFGIPMKPVRPTKMCSNDTYYKVHIDKYYTDTFPVQNGLKPDVLSPLLFYFPSECTIRKIQENQV